jgi:hypothetical protein
MNCGLLEQTLPQLPLVGVVGCAARDPDLPDCCPLMNGQQSPGRSEATSWVDGHRWLPLAEACLRLHYFENRSHKPAQPGQGQQWPR